MLHQRSLILATALIAGSLATGAFGTGALAQGSSQSTQPPSMPVLPSPQNNSSIPEKIAPQEPSSTGSTGGSGATLSDKLERSDGVIRPPAGIAPDMTVPAPVPDPGTTPVIRPQGSPGGNPTANPG
jgi:hypothetical protein